jgi:putative membrane protein
MSSERRRTHPADVIFTTATALRRLLWPFVIGAFASAGGDRPDRALVIGALGVVAGTTLGVLRWRATTYAVVDDTLSLRSGVLSPDETLVPLARISAVDTVSGPLQRLLGVVEVQVQVAGKSEPEVTLHAVKQRDEAMLRAALGHPGEVRREPDWRLSPRRAVLEAVTAPQVAGLAWLLVTANFLVQDLVTIDLALLDRAPDTPAEALLATAGVLATAWLVSAATVLVVFGGFEVDVDDGRLRIRRGFVRRRTATVPVDRVHAIRLIERPLRQPFGLLTVRMEVGGYAGSSDAARTLLPIVHREEVEKVLRRLVPSLARVDVVLRRPPRRALRRYVLPSLAGTAVAAAALTAAVPAVAPAGAVVMAVAAVAGVMRYTDAGFAVGEGVVLLRRRGVARTTFVARTPRLQRHALSQTLFQRRGHLADVAVAVTTGATVRIRHLDERDAQGLFTALRPQPAAR